MWRPDDPVDNLVDGEKKIKKQEKLKNILNKLFFLFIFT